MPRRDAARCKLNGYSNRVIVARLADHSPAAGSVKREVMPRFATVFGGFGNQLPKDAQELAKDGRQLARLICSSLSSVARYFSSRRRVSASAIQKLTLP